MHLTLFSRLTLGYLAIFAIVAAASSYAILELTDFGNQAESILRIDNRVLEHEKLLTDLLLAQSRAEQKFVLSRDEAWYLQFVRLKIDFEARAESAAAVADVLAQSIASDGRLDSQSGRKTKMRKPDVYTPGSLTRCRHIGN